MIPDIFNMTFEELAILFGDIPLKIFTELYEIGK